MPVAGYCCVGRTTAVCVEQEAGLRPATSIATNVLASPRVVPEVFDSLIRWSPQEAGSVGALELHGADSRAAEYPFLKYVQLFTATGGCYKGCQLRQTCTACLARRSAWLPGCLAAWLAA